MDSLRLNIDTDSWDPLRNGKPWNSWDVTDRIFGKTRGGWWGNESYWSLLASERCTCIWGPSKWDATKSPANIDEWIPNVMGNEKRSPMNVFYRLPCKFGFLSRQLWSMDWIRNQIGNGLTTPQSNIAMEQKTGLQWNFPKHTASFQASNHTLSYFDCSCMFDHVWPIFSVPQVFWIVNPRFFDGGKSTF